MIIAVHNFKGGAGKTTTTLNLGAQMMLKGFKVCLVDLSPQADLTYHLCDLPKYNKPIYSIYNVVKGQTDIFGAVLQSNYHPDFTIDIIPSHISLKEIYQEFKRDQFIGQVEYVNHLKELSQMYDFILLDCFNGLDALEQWSFYASDFVIIPVCDLESAKNSNLTLSVLNQSIKFKKSLGINANAVYKILLTNLEKIDSDNMTGYLNEPVAQKELRNTILKDYKENVFDTIIKKFSGFANTKTKGLPIMIMYHYDLYSRLLKEILAIPELSSLLHKI